jgi:hypothetical protein
MFGGEKSTGGFVAEGGCWSCQWTFVKERLGAHNTRWTATSHLDVRPPQGPIEPRREACRRRVEAGGAARSSGGSPHDPPPPEFFGTEGLGYNIRTQRLSRKGNSIHVLDKPLL